MSGAEKLYIAVVLGIGMPPRKMHGSEFDDVADIDPHIRDMWQYRVRALVEYERLVPGLGSTTGFQTWMVLFFQWCEEQRENNES